MKRLSRGRTEALPGDTAPDVHKQEDHQVTQDTNQFHQAANMVFARLAQIANENPCGFVAGLYRAELWATAYDFARRSVLTDEQIDSELAHMAAKAMADD